MLHLAPFLLTVRNTLGAVFCCSHREICIVINSPSRLSAAGSECCCAAADLLAIKPLPVSLMKDCPEVEIACLGIRGEGMCVVRKS